MLTRFDHITILVRDLAAATSCYSALLGCEPRWRGTREESGTESSLFGLGNALIELTAPLGDSDASAGLHAHLAAHGEGLQALAFGCDDAAFCSSQLRAAGLRATAPEAGQARGLDGTSREYRTVELSPRATRGLPVLLVERPEALQLMAAEPRDAGAVHALDHVVIRSAELDQAVALYRDGLGLRLALDTVLGDTRMLFFRVGGVTVEVVQDRTGGASDAFYGAAYRVQDLELARDRLKSAGFSPSEPRAGRKAGTFVFSVRDKTCGVPTLVIRDPSRDR